MFKNKTLIIIISVILVLAVAAGGYFFVAARSKQNSQPAQDDTQQQVVHKLSSTDLGLTVIASPDKKKVKFSIAKLSDIQAIEYQLTYEANSTQQEIAEGGDARVQRGITGDSKVKPGDASYESPWLDLGSCSRNICRYDTGVKTIDLTLKITKKDGKVYETEQSLDL